MNRRDLLLCNEPHIIDFAIECGWLHRFGYRLFDLSWEFDFSIWVTTWPKEGCELTTRRNPRRTLRLRLEEEGFPAEFVGDEFVQSLVGCFSSVDLAALLDTMALIAIAKPESYSEPIVLRDEGSDAQ